MTGFAFEVRSFPDTPHPDEVTVSVRVGSGAKSPSTVYVCSLRGAQRDYLDTMADAALSTFMYGEKARDVARSCADVLKLARVHAASHEF